MSAGGAAATLQAARAFGREALSEWRGINPDRALEACDRALALLLEKGPSEPLADLLRWKGSVLRDLGMHSRASDHYAQSLAVADAMSYMVGRAHALNCFGTVAQVRGDLTSAMAWYREAGQLATALGDSRLLAMIEQNLGILAESQHRSDDALAHFRAAQVAFEHAGDESGLAWVLNNLGKLYMRTAAYEQAAESLERALLLACGLRDVVTEGCVEENRARLWMALGEYEEAEEAATRALGIAAQRGDDTSQAAALYVLARVAQLRGAPTGRVEDMLDRALTLAGTGEDLELKAEILAELASCCEDRGDATQATKLRADLSTLSPPSAASPESPPPIA